MFTFQIHPVSLEEGVELSCEGLMERPIKIERLFEAVVLATQFGRGLDFEIQIFDFEGRVAEVIGVSNPPVLVD